MLDAATVCVCGRLQPVCVYCGVQVRLFEGADGEGLVSSHQHACCTMYTLYIAHTVHCTHCAAAVCSLGVALGWPSCHGRWPWAVAMGWPCIG